VFPLPSILHPTTKRLIILCIIFLLSGAEAQASSQAEILKTAQELKLARHPTWLKLLHYERGGKQSVVLTDSFFLSPNGKSDPEAELTATINAYFAAWDANANAQARCRFPARYYWLSQQLSLPDYNLRNGKCQNLEKWALFDSVQSISLLLVSGYFGNPASTFGHALLKFNTDSSDDQSGLFDLTLSYGALVPENENTLRYVARGLFGGYKAGFSDKYFYTQDLVYSRTQFRDIWDYRIALTNKERTLLILHIWEIIGNKFDYYFLDKNCAYRLAELLELVLQKDLVDNGRFWYLPVEIFYRLKEIDKAWHKSTGTNLIQSVHFIPSSQRILYHQLRLLVPDELEAFNVILREGIHSMPGHLAKFTSDRQIVILDSLLFYQQYRLIAEEPDSDRDRREFKDQVLLARLQLPAHPKLSPKIKELPSPAEGSRPMVFGAGMASDADGKTFLRLNWSPFKQERVGQNSLEGDELVVLDLNVGFFEEEHNAFLDQLDLVRVLNLNTLPVAVADESQWSWQLRGGVDRIEEDGENRYDGIVSFGAGHAWLWNDAIIGYGMLDVAGHTLDPFVRLRPHLGLKFDLGELRTWVYSGAESVNYEWKFHEIWGGKMQYQLTDRYAIHLEVSNEKATRTSLALNWYW